MSLMLKSSTKKKVFCLTLLKARFEFYSKANTEHGTKFVGQMQASFWGGKKKKAKIMWRDKSVSLQGNKSSGQFIWLSRQNLQ